MHYVLRCLPLTFATYLVHFFQNSPLGAFVGSTGSCDLIPESNFYDKYVGGLNLMAGRRLTGLPDTYALCTSMSSIDIRYLLSTFFSKFTSWRLCWFHRVM